MSSFWQVYIKDDEKKQQLKKKQVTDKTENQ